MWDQSEKNIPRYDPALQISVTLKMDWDVGAVGKPIPTSYVTNEKNGTLLVDILNKAAGERTNEALSTTYYDSTYLGGQGYTIRTIPRPFSVSFKSQIPPVIITL